MTKQIPIVQGALLWDDSRQGPLVPLDTPAWFAWLENPVNNCFSYALHNRAKTYIDGFVTVRKERRHRGTVYWSAYRHQGQRLRKLYIGRSQILTKARLEKIAARLRSRDGPSKTYTFSVAL